MSMIAGSISTGGNRTRQVTQIKNPANGAVVATISVSKPAKKKPKKLPYNFKAISNQILLSKTSSSASKAVTKARGTIAMLLRQSRSGEYDDQDIELAIAHARKMERAAKKRVKHLKQEEEIEKKGKSEETDDDLLLEELEEQQKEEEEFVFSEEQLQQLMEEYEQMMQESMEEMMQEASLEELAEEFDGAVYDMSPEELEQLKKKHRSDEMREIADADMKYLRAVFNKLEREKQALASGSGSSSGSGNTGYSGAGVSLELSGMEMPVETVDLAAVAEGGNIDVMA